MSFRFAIKQNKKKMNLIKDRQADDYSEVSKVQALTRVNTTNSH